MSLVSRKTQREAQGEAPRARRCSDSPHPSKDVVITYTCSEDVVFTGESQVCCVCYEVHDVVKLACQHHVCQNCIDRCYNRIDTTKQDHVGCENVSYWKCPRCRAPYWAKQ